MFAAVRAHTRASEAEDAIRGPGGARSRTLTPAETAWIALIPCAIVMTGAIVALGPPLGRVLFRPGPDPLWPADWWGAHGRPEPVKHGRYAIAVLAPLMLAGAILMLSRIPLRMPSWSIRVLGVAGQAGVVAFVAVAVHGQGDQVAPSQTPILDRGLLVGGAVVVAVMALALRRRGAIDRIVMLARERPLTRIACLAVAVAYSATWLVGVVTTDGLSEDDGTMNWIPNGAYAVLDGRTPLVDVHLIYAKLLPYPAALVMSTFGATTFVFTLFLAALDLAAFLAVYAVFRRIAGSVLALALLLPFVAVSDAGHLMYLGSIWPMRYGGTFVLAWLVARHIDGRSPRRTWVLFLVATLVAIDTPDFGLAALLASVVALACAAPPRTAQAALRLAGGIAGGMLGGIAAVSALTLLRAGELPQLDLLTEWPRIFTGLGWFSLPLPGPGLQLVVYATLAAAIAVAAVRLARAAVDVLLTSMLAWSGIFGLVAGNYYVARPDEVKLLAMLSAGAFALALLTIVCVRAISARRWRAPTPAELLVLLALAASMCMIPRWRSPAPLIERMADAPPPSYRRFIEPFVDRHTRRGEKVVMFIPESYRIAYDLGLDNVAPYEMQTAVVTRRQMQLVLDTIDREGTRTVFTATPGQRVTGDAEAAPEHLQAFEQAGFEPIASNGAVIAWRRSR